MYHNMSKETEAANAEIAQVSTAEIQGEKEILALEEDDEFEDFQEESKWIEQNQTVHTNQ